MSVRFGYPEQYSDHYPLTNSHAKFYFKTQINVRTSVLSYTTESLFADIGAYLGLALGFSIMDITGAIRYLCQSQVFCKKDSKCGKCFSNDIAESP